MGRGCKGKGGDGDLMESMGGKVWEKKAAARAEEGGWV